MHSCARREISPCTLPYVDKPVFQVPSLGKPAPNVEAKLSKQYALLQSLCSLKGPCKHAYICSWKGCGAIVNEVWGKFASRLAASLASSKNNPGRSQVNNFCLLYVFWHVAVSPMLIGCVIGRRWLGQTVMLPTNLVQHKLHDQVLMCGAGLTYLKPTF